MTLWEKMVQRHYEQLLFKVEWLAQPESLFLLAWNGEGVQVVLMDSHDKIGVFSASGVKGEFLKVLSYLWQQNYWKKIFKDWNVSFKWATARTLTGEETRTLLEAGVEPFPFFGNKASGQRDKEWN